MVSAASPGFASPLSRRCILGGVILLACAALVAYFPALRGDFVLDDNSLLADNILVKAPDGLYRMWLTSEPIDYWPVANSSFWLEWRLWGLNPTGYHVTNLLLHIAAGLLIWAVLRKLSVPGGFLAALLFIVHPVNVEAVAWIAQRKDTLATVFFLLSIFWYLKEEETQTTIEAQSFSDANHPARGADEVHRWYWLSLAAFLLAMLSKGSVAVEPVVLLLVVWWKRGLRARDVARMAPFFLVAIVLTAVNLWFRAHGGEVMVRDVNFAQRLAGAGAVLWFYLSKALAPIDLIFSYPPWQIDPHVALWWLPFLAAIVVTLLLGWKSLSGRTKSGRALWFTWLLYGVALAPMLGFADVGSMQYSLVADHYQHIAIIAVVALAAAAWSAWYTSSRGAERSLAGGCAIVVLGLLTFLSWQQSRLYAGPVTLYEVTIRDNPGSWFARNNLGIVLRKNGRTADAKRQFDEALRLNPNAPLTHYNLANLFRAEDKLEDAIAEYQRALELQPSFYDAHNNLGEVLLVTKGPIAALAQFAQAVASKPNTAIARNNLGFALFAEGRLPEAIQQLKVAVHLQPDLAPAHRNLGRALAKVGRTEEAIQQLQQAIQLDPNQFVDHYYLGDALTDAGKFPEAIEQFRRALELKPDYAEAEGKLALALLNSSQPAEALEHCKKALQLRPDDTEACANLAIAYDQLHQPAEAIAAAEKAIEMARAQKQAKEAEQIEAWLKTYRTQQGKAASSESKPGLP